MSSSLFSGDLWTNEELRQLLKKLEQMYANGTRQATLKDQTLIFGSTKELKERISDLRLELNNRGALGSAASKPKKQIRITSVNKGFR